MTKTCDKHHGQIQYDGMIYLECPLCEIYDLERAVSRLKEKKSWLEREIALAEDKLENTP